MYTKTNNKGFTLVETLVYIAGLALLLAVLSTIFIYMYDWYRAVTIVPRVDQAGSTLVDRITRDLRTGESINLGQSALNTANGALSVTGTIDSNQVTKRFSLSNGYLSYEENGSAPSNLSPNGMTVSRLYFTNVTSPESSAVKFDIDITYNTKQGSTTKTYGGFVILRQSYE
jgi:Tfp pilus assembly protein FimT